MNKIIIFFQVLFFVYFLVLVYLYFFQRSLMYHPNENNYSNDKLGVKIEKIKIVTRDDIHLLG